VQRKPTVKVNCCWWNRPLVGPSLVVLEAWPSPRGSSRTPDEGLGLAWQRLVSEIKVKQSDKVSQSWTLFTSIRQVGYLLRHQHGQIIHEAGEGKASRPGPRYQDRMVHRKFTKHTTLGAEIYREKICSLLKFWPSGISIRPAILPQFTTRLDNISKQRR